MCLEVRMSCVTNCEHRDLLLLSNRKPATPTSTPWLKVWITRPAPEAGMRTQRHRRCSHGNGEVHCYVAVSTIRSKFIAFERSFILQNSSLFFLSSTSLSQRRLWIVGNTKSGRGSLHLLGGISKNDMIQRRVAVRQELSPAVLFYNFLIGRDCN